MNQADVATHPLQSKAWADFRNAMGVTAVFDRSLLVTFHHIPYSPWTIGYVPKGPPPTREMIERLKILGKKYRAIFIQLEPNTQKVSVPLQTSRHPLFTKYTFLLDLRQDESALLSAMHPKTRYNIGLAKRKGVVVSEDNSKEAFEAYLSLSQETTKRQGFFAHNTRYQRTMWEHLHKAGIAHLFTARYNGKILAAWIIFLYNNIAYYPYGASSREHKEVMAPTLLLWETALWAKKNHAIMYDLWGALGPHPDPSDPWYGFHKFKQGFSPKLVEYAGSFDLVLNPVLYQLYGLIDRVRWMVLRHR